LCSATVRIYAAVPVTLSVDLLNPKSTGFDIVEDYYCAKFRVIPISGFRFATKHTYTHTPIYIHTHTHTHHDNVIAISGPP